MNKNLNENIKWGYFHERFAKLEYERMFNTKVFSLGLINHDNIEWLAASPDGIVNDDTYGCKLVEFKCPLKRKFKHDAKVLNYYWMQCQIQMEVCNLPICHFLETKIEPEYYSDIDVFLKDSLLKLSLQHQLPLQNHHLSHAS